MYHGRLKVISTHAVCLKEFALLQRSFESKIISLLAGTSGRLR